MAVINTNYSSVIVQNDLTVTNRTLGSAMEQLSTGKRINTAVDDASGLSMSNKRAMQVVGLNQAMRNANDGVSMLQTADGALGQVNNILNRMRELAVQAGNDTHTSKDRYALDQEYQQLNREISRIASHTQWNGMNVLNTTEVGAPGTSSDVSAGVRNVKFQVGANSNQYLNIGLKDFSYNLGVSAIASETKLTLGDMRDKQFFQFSIAKDAINNGTTGTQLVSFDLDRAIAGATMTEQELVDFENKMAGAITASTGYTNVAVSRVGNEIYVRDGEGRSIGASALTGGSTAATRGTTDGFSEQTTSNLTRTVDHYFGTPSTYWYTDYYYNSTTTRFTVGDIKGKQNLSVSVDGRTFNFDLTNRIAGASITTGAEGELGDIVSKLQTAIAGVPGASAYTVSRDDANRAFSITYSYTERIGTAGGAATITGGSTSDTRGTTLGYVGSQVSVGSTATAAATPTNTSVFSGSARLNDTRISTHVAATEAIGRIDNAMAAVDREQTTMGSVMNRLTHAGDNAGQISRNTMSSRSRLSDADYAATTTEVVRQQIILQASMAMLAQASQVPNSVITLLK